MLFAEGCITDAAATEAAAVVVVIVDAVVVVAVVAVVVVVVNGSQKTSGFGAGIVLCLLALNVMLFGD